MDTAVAATTPPATLGTQPWWHRLPKPKGHIGSLGIALLAFVVCVTLVMVCARVLAFPGIWPAGAGLDALRALGGFLNQSLTLQWVPPADRHHVLYLVLLPTAALLIALARLTFGLRVLGFRSILLALGFQEIGVLPSLALLLVVVAVVVFLRTPMQRMHLPLYARIAITLGVTAVLMVLALFVGPWVRSELVWSIAFFPVLILAMMAEGIAGTLVHQNGLTAAWRAGWTVIVALLIAWVSQNPVVRELALHFPELMLTQLVAVVLVSEFLDFRLLQDWQARRLGGEETDTPVEPVQEGQMRVAVVRTRTDTGIIGRLGPAVASPGGSMPSVQHLVDALRDQGYAVKVFEGDVALLTELRRFLPPDPDTGAPGGIVLNLATGIQGHGRFGQVPSMLELAGVAYTGPNPISHAHMSDRYVSLSLLREAGVATPRCRLAANAQDEIGDLEFPLAVRPRFEPDANPIIVRNHRRELSKAVQNISSRYGQACIVESHLDGPEIRVALLGNGNKLECMPLLQVDGNGRICPAPLEPRLADRVRFCAQRAYIVSGCRDYARVDIRLTRFAEPVVVQVRSLDILARRGSFIAATEAGGYSLQNLVQRIVELGWARCGGAPLQPAVSVDVAAAPAAVSSDNVVKLPEPKLAKGNAAA